MKIWKLLLSAATACLLVGGSGAAMAVDCADGSIIYDRVDEIVINGQDCYIHNTLVIGSVKVQNSASFILIDSTVGGEVKVTDSGTAILVGNSVLDGGLQASRNDYSGVVLNIVSNSIWVNDNLQADVVRNVAGINILCSGNDKLDSFLNQAGGELDCMALGQ